MTTSIRERAKEALKKVDALGIEATRIFIALDRDRLLRDAAELDSRVAAGETLPLAGCLCSIKDLIDRRGEITTAGSLLLAERPQAADDAEIVTRLEAAGALVFGRTNMTEFAYSGVGLNPHHGTPGCIYDRTLVPGGSSCGAALSVAHGICNVAIGTDTGGSVRIPAAINGLYGIKPTTGRVSLVGVHPLSASMDSVGALADNWETACRVQSVLEGRDPDKGNEDTSGTVKKPGDCTIGIPDTPFASGLDDSVEKQWRVLLDRLGDAGYKLQTIDLGWMEELAESNRTMVSIEAHALYSKEFNKLKQVGDPNVLERIRFAESVSAAEQKAVYMRRADAIEKFSAAFADVDVIAAPTVAIERPSIKAAKADFATINAALLRNTAPINFVDGCAVSVPVVCDDAAPFALMLAAARDQDAVLLATAGTIVASLA